MDASIINPQDSTGVLVLLVISIIIPALVAALTKKNATPAVKTYVMLVLNLVAGVLTAFVTAHNAGMSFDWKGAGISFATSVIVSGGTHMFVLKPAGLTGSTGVIQTALPGGLGSTVAEADPVPLPENDHESKDPDASPSFETNENGDPIFVTKP